MKKEWARLIGYLCVKKSCGRSCKKSIWTILKSCICCVLCAMLLVSIVVQYSSEAVVRVQAAQSERQDLKTVKVGFYAYDGFYMIDESGNRSGYGYEFLQMLGVYNNWKYEYVGYDKSWTEILEMLDRGEIDMLATAQKSPEREKKYAYSTTNVGTNKSVLSVRIDDPRYVVGDVRTYNNMKIGMMADSVVNDSFETYVEENPFEYSKVYYNSAKELSDALESGEVDAILSSNIRKTTGETVLEQFNSQDYYVIVKKGDEALLPEVNFGMNQMDLNSPGWRTSLEEKYYNAMTGAGIAMTAGEIRYLDECREKGVVFRVITNPDLKPYSYFEHGVAKGIIPQIFSEIAENLGIEYEIIETSNYAEYSAMSAENEVDIDLTCTADASMAEERNLKLSDSYYTTMLSRLTKTSFSGDIKSLSVLSNTFSQTAYRDSIAKGCDTVECGNIQAGVNAVRNGITDAMYLYAYTADMAVELDEKNRLHAVTLAEYNVDLTFGIRAQNDSRLLVLINKGIKSIDNTHMNEIIQAEMSKIKKPVTLQSLIYNYPVVAVIMMGLIVVILFVIVIVIAKSRAMRTIQQQEMELARFMGYVCESTEMVLEVNLKTAECIRHEMKDGQLVSEKKVYDFANYTNRNGKVFQEDFDRISSQLSKEGLYDMIHSGGGGTYFEARVRQDAPDEVTEEQTMSEQTMSDHISDHASDKGIEAGVREQEAQGYQWYSYSLRAIPVDEEHPDNFIIFKKNIDSVKKEEEHQRMVLTDALNAARNASAAKGDFLSRMSHEIRTPLNAVIGYMGIAEDEENCPDKVLHCIKNSKLAAEHLLGIINDVLDISSIESGRMKIAKEDFDLKTQLTTVSTIFYNQAKDKGVEFNTHIKNLSEEWVIGDSLRVNQILMNLLSNAVKFTPEHGKIDMSVEQAEIKENVVYIKFTVQDSGIGMSEAYKQRLFRPFEQEEAATARKYGGSGLGLSITFNLIKMMGGSIEVDSKQGMGTKFTVSLHFQKSEKNDVLHTKHIDYSHIRALIVDDEPNSCTYMKKLLKQYGVKSDAVQDGEAAVRQIRKRQGTDYAYKLCIMDWNMPGMNGIEAARVIREQCDEEIPIIIATAYDAVALEDEAKMSGVSKVIAKPLFQSTIFDLLVTTFGRYEPATAEEEENVDFRGYRMILAEDNEMNMEIAVDVLSKAGIEVDGAVNGKEAAELFERSEPGTYQAILMDVQMPVMNGYEATQKIRASKHAEAHTIPIIAMTANAFAEDVSQSIASGMNAHISKPIDYKKLFGAIGKYVKKRQE